MKSKTLQKNLIEAVIIAALTSLSNVVLAQSTGGCDTYAPNTTGGSSQVVTCTSGVAPAATAGVISMQNTTTVGNNVTVNVVNGTSLVIDGATIGIGSGARVSNHGNLNTGSMQNGYGISSGSNGRSQAGNNIFTNESDGTIYTRGGNAAGMYISATNASSAANSLTNAGAIQTDGAGAAGMRLVSGSTSSSVVNSIVNSGTIITNGSAAHGVQLSGVGAVTIVNSGTITANGSNAFGIYSAGNITALTNSQGGSSPLTFSGVLPTNYNATIASPTVYGKLDASNGAVTGVMNFSIASASTVSATTYSAVLSGIKVNNLGNSYGTISIGGTQYQWALVHRINGSADQTDLVLSTVVQPSLVALEEVLATQSYLIAPIESDTQVESLPIS